MFPWYGYWHPWGWGWHRRWRISPFAWAWAPPSREYEKSMLEEQARILERELKNIRKRLEELQEEEVKNA
ncbi:MAG TPA: DUF5320 domain-containing protein [Dehalococcoidia bacterium]|nr:DUF5320 domain-containing protein [Dehalococcoidia bacterium]